MQKAGSTRDVFFFFASISLSAILRICPCALGQRGIPSLPSSPRRIYLAGVIAVGFLRRPGSIRSSQRKNEAPCNLNGCAFFVSSSAAFSSAVHEKDENEISRPTELVSAPKPVEMLWKPGRKYDDPRQRLEVFFRPWTLSGLESRKGNGRERQRKSSR